LTLFVGKKQETEISRKWQARLMFQKFFPMFVE
jgi:hypothetical protein